MSTNNLATYTKRIIIINVGRKTPLWLPNELKLKFIGDVSSGKEVKQGQINGKSHFEHLSSSAIDRRTAGALFIIPMD